MPCRIYTLAGGIWLLFNAAIADDIPTWAQKDATHFHEHQLSLICSGRGLSLDLARIDALESCKSTATTFLNSSGTARSTVIETEKGVSFHKEITESVTFEGLLCIPSKEESMHDKEQDEFMVWIKCEFDLSKVHLSKNLLNLNTGDENKEHSGVLNRTELTSSISKTKTPRSKSAISKSKTVINLMTIPPCDDVLIKGIRSRTVKCIKHPISLVIFEGDTDIIVRSLGSASKTIKIDQKRLIPNEILQVLLDSI